MTEATTQVSVHTSSTCDRPPKDSFPQAAIWWLTRPWANTIAVLAPISLLVSGLMLFRYQAQIERPELLFQAVASPAALTFVLALGFVLLLLPMVMVFGSVWFADIATSFYVTPCTNVPKGMPRLLLVGSLIWLITVIASSVTGLGLLMRVGSAVVFIAYLVAGVRIEANTWRVTSNRSAAARGVGVGFTFWIATMASSMAPLALLVLGPALPTNDGGNYAALTLMSLLMLIGLGTSWRLFSDFAQEEPLAEVRKRVMIGVLACTGIIGLLWFGTIDLQTLHALGVYSTKPTTFVVGSGLQGELEAAGLKVDPSTADINGKARRVAAGSSYLVTGYVRYQFGPQLVLCTKPFDPTQQKALPSQRGCLDLRVGEVRRILPAQDAKAVREAPPAVIHSPQIPQACSDVRTQERGLPSIPR